MSREEIASLMRKWIAEDKMFSSAMLNNRGVSSHEQNRRCASGELFKSRLGNVLFTDESLRRQLEDWLYGEDKCVYTIADLGSLKGLVTLYEVNKASANGDFLRFEDLGKSATLYIE